MTEEFENAPEYDTAEPVPAETDESNEDSLSDATQAFRITPRQKIVFVSIGAAVLVGLLSLILGLLLFSGRNNEDDRILQNVFAAGVDLSGMTVEEAASALHLATDHSLMNEPLVIRIYDGTLLLYPADTNAILDVEAVAQAAYSYGRSGNHADDQQIRKNAHRRSYTIPLLSYLNLNLDFIRNTVDSYCAALESMYAEPVVTLIGTRPIYGDPSVEHQSMRITTGTPLRQLDAEDLYNQILDAYSMNELLLEYETPEIIWPTKLTAQDLFDQYCTPAQDAILDEKTYSVTPEIYGYGFDVNALQDALDASEPGDTIEFKMSFLVPEVLMDEINSNLFLETISTCTSNSSIDDNARDANLQLSCKAINGYVIKPGETFSFLKVLGDVSSEAGYKDAPISIYNDSVNGGGISQTATALYYCALHADLEIVERHNHKYEVDFIELGLDAYVNGASTDLRFRNNSNIPIRIDASVKRHAVTISFRTSSKLSYNVTLRTEITAKDLPVTTYQMVLPDNINGYQDGDIIVSGIEGYTVSVTKEKTDNTSGNLISTSTVSSSTYKKRDEIIARIDESEEDNTTEPTTEAATLS